MIVIRDLKKAYGKFQALDGLNMEIKQGELYGFVGPNGAGKTTTMRILAGLLSFDSGEVYMDDVDVAKHPQQVKKKMGYMPDFFGVYDNLKVSEYMDFFSNAYGLMGKSAKKQILEKLDMVNLTDKENSYVDGLSRGMKQRLCLARCLLCNPKVLILDEPASGLDPRARFDMKEILCQLSQMGITFLISSHILPELAEMCTNVGIIERGKMIISGTVDEIMKQFNNSNPIKMRCILGQEDIVAYLKENPLVQNVSIHGDMVYAGFGGSGMEEAKLLQDIVNLGAMISEFGRAEGNLESLFIQITQKEEV